MLVGVWYFLASRDVTVVEQGTIDFAAELPVVVVRDEEVIAVESYGRAHYLVPDQQRVEQETPVVEVFKWGYNDKVMSDLVDVRTKILQYESGLLQGTAASELSSINGEIDDITREIRIAANAQSAEADDVVALESQLARLMDERAQYLQSRGADDQQLEEYRKQEQQLAERVNSWRDVWTAPNAGVVSYYFDGYEPLLNAENIREASASQVRSILDGTLPMAQIAEGTEPLYRLVNNFQWYIVIPSYESVLEFANDNVFAVEFTEYPDRKFEGTIIGHIVEGSDHLYVMEFNEDIGQLVNTRRATARLTADFTGFRVPVDAVRQVDGKDGVYVVHEPDTTFVPVTVRATENSEAIVVPDDPGSALRAGVSVSG